MCLITDRTCYDSFRTSWWKKKLESLNSSKNNPDVEVTNDTPTNELFHLIDYYIIYRQDVHLSTAKTFL